MHKVKTLRRLLEQQIFAVPQLQREFVWNGKKAAALLDSIYRHIPIGTILLWKTDPQRRNLLREHLHILPHYDSANDEIWFLIDGQQRLSVIYQAFHGETKKNFWGRDIDFRRLCFAVWPYDDDDKGTTFSYRPSIEGRYVSIVDILSGNWRHKLRKYAHWKLRKIEECRRRILNYELPLVSVHTNNLEDVRTTFIRINSGGMRVTSADQAFARASRFNLRQLARVARLELHDFDMMSFDPIILGFMFANGGREVGQKAIQTMIGRWDKEMRSGKLKIKDFNKKWKRYANALSKSVDFLRENFCVYNDEFLPSENMLATLPIFFLHNGAQPSSAQRKELRKWFWATALGQRYSGRGYRNNIISDLRFFQRLAKHRRGRFILDERVDKADLARAQYTRSAALTNAFFCLLAMRKPRRFSNGEPIPTQIAAARANKKNKHHIFPKALLQSQRVGYKDYNSVCNICFLPAEENQEIGKRRPSDYFREVRRNGRFATTMKSHLINRQSTAGIWNGSVKKGFRQFRRERLDLLCKAFEQEAGTKVFKRET
jgi:hypothetical protein